MNARRLVGRSILVIMIAALAAPATPALGQESWISYAAKFVCGKEDDSGGPVAQGKYRTIVNIHNPHYLLDAAGALAPLKFFKKAVLAQPQGQPPFPPSCKQEERLPPDGALAVNCGNIRTLLALSGLVVPGDIEGFLVIEVPPQAVPQVTPRADVVAVYTARYRSNVESDVQTMDVERVSPEDIIGIPVQDPCVPD